MNNLKEYREKHEMSVKTLANIFKVSKSTINAWENGTKTPSMMQLESLSYLYDCSFSDLYPYEKPDPYEFPQRRSAVFKKYMKRLNAKLIALILGIAALASIIVLLCNLAPQIHGKWHAQNYFDEMKNYVYQETNVNYGKVITFAKEHSDLAENEYIHGVAVVTYDSKYIVYFHYDKMRAMIDINGNLILTKQATMTVNDQSVALDIADYQDVYYIIIYESKEPGLKEIVEQYKIFNGITA